MINLELYKVFYTVAKTGSLTKAAEALYISQPAVSQSIKQLETAYGGKLFRRTHSGMVLTEVGGKQVFQLVEKAMKYLETAEFKYSELNSSAAGLLRICSSDMTMTNVLLPYVEKYHRKYPNVSLVLQNGSSKEIVGKVVEKKVDLGVVNLPVEDSRVDVLDDTHLLHDVFVCSSRFSDLLSGVIPLFVLKDYPLIMLDTSTTSRAEVTEFAHSHNVDLAPEIECSRVDMMIGLAKMGIGVACVPLEYVKKELESGELKMVKTEPELPARSLGIVTLKDEVMTFAAREFINIMQEGTL